MINKNLILITASKLESASKENPSTNCFIGFDGFTDEILEAVAEVKDKTAIPFDTIKNFGRKILDASDKSCNIELISKKTKMGGNGPILANALLNLKFPVALAAAIGSKEKIEPLFLPLVKECKKIFPLGPSGHSDAIEFQDGKIIFGKLGGVKNITYKTLKEAISKDELIEQLDQAKLFASVNWTMIEEMNGIWKGLLQEIIPHLKNQQKRILFVDLADPAKRTDADLKEALALLKQFKGPFEVILGLNEAESERISSLVGAEETTAEELQKRTELDTIIIHKRKTAEASSSTETAKVTGPYFPKPKLSTGGGDNFNAGFIAARLRGLTLSECLIAGVSYSGYYISEGKSARLDEWIQFLKNWNESR